MFYLGNIAPYVIISRNNEEEGAIVAGTPAFFELTLGDVDDVTVDLFIDWDGDNSIDETLAVDYAVANGPMTISHVYQEARSYCIKVKHPPTQIEYNHYAYSSYRRFALMIDSIAV